MADQKTLIFDWGGVLMRTEDYAPRQQWDARLGLLAGSVERVVHGLPSWREAQLGRVALGDYWQDVARELDLDDDDLSALQRDFYSGDRLDEGLINMIRALRGEGVPVALLSNNIHPLRDEMATLGVTDLFDPIVISAEIGVMKPDPAAYEAALDMIGVAAEQTLFIDDFAHNVEGARAVGMAALHFQAGIDLEARIREWLQSA